MERRNSEVSVDSEGEPDKPLDMTAVLLTMGFKEEDVKAALSRMSSVEAAVEFLMQRPASRAAAEATPMNQLQDNLAGVAAEAAAGVTGLAARFSRGWSDLFGAGKLEEAAPAIESGAGASGKPKLVSDLLALGFSESQASDAAKRCSSVEAAVDWITAGGRG